MNNLIDKFLDGELTEEEAVTLLDVITRDPKLEAELRTYEEMLSFAAGEAPGDPSSHFTDGVIERIAAGPARLRASAPSLQKPAWQRAWLPRFALGVALVTVFAIGRMTAGNEMTSYRGDGGGPATSTLHTGSGDAAQMAGVLPLAERPRLIRLVYVPGDPDVSRVTVAGTFNGWNPEGVAMKRIGDVWTAQLSLPPGAYEYMFVENGENWVTDPLALQTRDDGFGRKNAVLDVSI